MFETPSPLSRIKNLIPVDPAWLAKWEQVWKSNEPEREKAMREAAERAQELRNILLF